MNSQLRLCMDLCGKLDYAWTGQSVIWKKLFIESLHHSMRRHCCLKADRRGRACFLALVGARESLRFLVVATVVITALPQLFAEPSHPPQSFARSSVAPFLAFDAAPSPWTRAAGGDETGGCSDDTMWVDARGYSCLMYYAHTEHCISAALHVVDGVDAMDACCTACSWVHIATMPATKITHFEGYILHQSGGVAGLEFDVQPTLNVSGVYTVIEATLGNNPGCSGLNGNTVATVVGGMAAFTDLWLDKPGRGYTLKFCAGQCSNLQAWFEASDVRYVESNSFDIQPGKLHVVQEPGTPETGVPLEALLEVQQVTTFGGIRHWKAFEDYNFSVTVALDGVHMSGRRTLWPVKGRVQFTDLIIETASYPSKRGFRMVYRTCFGASETHCLQSFADLGMPGQSMLAVSASFRVRHTDPSEVLVVFQPTLTLSGRPIGSICENQIGATCKKFKVARAPSFRLVDRFKNNVDSGSWFACATLLRNESGPYVQQPLLGSTRTSLAGGIAEFDALYILEVKSSYVLNVTIHNQDLPGESCASTGFGWVLSDFFDVSFENARKIVIIKNINTTGGAGNPFTQQPQLALQDDNGNTVLQGNDIEIFAQIFSYRPDPSASSNSSSSLPTLFASCNFNPLKGIEDNCVEYDRFPTQSQSGVADLANEVVLGSTKKNSLHVQSMGFYTFRFYAEALVTYSQEFFVRNDLGSTMKLIAQPGPSSCSPGIAGHNDFRCSSGGLLDAQPRFEVFDRFGNKALYGEQEFRISIFTNLGGGFLLCDQRYRNPETNKPVYTACLHSSHEGFVDFTDLRIDSIGKGYVLQMIGTGRSREDSTRTWSPVAENKIVAAVVTQPFDVFAVRNILLVSTPSATPAGCSAYPPPTIQIRGFDDAGAEEETDINFAGGTGVVFTFACIEESDDVVLQTGRDSSVAGGTYVKCCTFCPSHPSCQAAKLQVNAISGRPWYALDSNVMHQYAFFCYDSTQSGKQDDACKTSGFWRISQHAGNCNNVSSNETALQTCESGVGASTYSEVPASISLRAEWHTRTATAASLAADGDIEYVWTIAEKDSIWFSRGSVPCAADTSILSGKTQTTAKDGLVLFDDMQMKTSNNFTLRFKFGIPGSVASFTEETQYEVTQGQIGRIEIVESPTRGLVESPIDPPILVQPRDLYGNAIHEWGCSDATEPGRQWQCTSRDGKLLLIANLHPCSMCTSTVPVTDPSVAEYSTGLKFSFRPGKSGEQYVFRIEIRVTNIFEGCPGVDDTTRMPRPVMIQTTPFDVDNSEPDKIIITKFPSSEIQSGEIMTLTAELRDKNDQAMAIDYVMNVTIVKAASRVAGHVYRYCGNPVKGNENTKCYFEDQVQEVNTITGAQFELTIKTPGDYLLRVIIEHLEPRIESQEFALSVTPAAPDEYISLAMQPWTVAPATATAGQPISPDVDFGIFDSFGNFMDNYDYFYPIIDLTIKSNTGTVLYCPLTNCSSDNAWLPYENQRILFKATPPQGPDCESPPFDADLNDVYTGGEVCGTFTLPTFKIEQLWDQVQSVKTECNAEHFIMMEANLVLQLVGTGNTAVLPHPSFPDVIKADSILVPISGSSTKILVSPSVATSLGLYFIPLQERAQRPFSDQPRVQLLDKYGNPVCKPAPNVLVKVRVCSGRNIAGEEQFMSGISATSNGGFPSHCNALTETSIALEEDGAYVLFENLYTNRTGYNKLFFLTGSFPNISMEMDVASGIPWEVLIVQQPQDSVAEEVLLSSGAPSGCQVCLPNVTVGVKILDVAGNELTDPAMVSVSISCGVAHAKLHGTKHVMSTNNGYAAFTDLVITYNGTQLLSAFTCALIFQTTKGPQHRTKDFSVALVSHAAIHVLATETVVHRLIRGISTRDGGTSEIMVEVKDILNQTIVNSRRSVSVSGLAESLMCCCYLGNCKTALLSGGVVGFPSIKSSQVSAHYRLSFDLITEFSTIQVVSMPFAVVNDAPSRLIVKASPSTVLAGSLFEVLIQV